MAATLTLLSVVNAVLKRVDVIQDSGGDLTAFTGNAQQISVDVLINVINDVIDQIYSAADNLQGETAESTFTLVADDLDYALQSDYVRMVGNPVDAVNNRVLIPYVADEPDGGYLKLREDRPDRSDFTGVPRHWVVNSSDGELELDVTPTSDEAGDSYTYVYEKAINLSATTDTFPFDDEVTRALYAAFAQAWKRERNKQFDELAFQWSMSRATQKLRNAPARQSYGVRQAVA